MCRVGFDGKRRTSDVLLLQVGQKLDKFLPPASISPRHLARHLPSLPDAKEPDPVEAGTGKTIEDGVGNIVERGGPTDLPAQFLQVDARVDFVERGIDDL